MDSTLFATSRKNEAVIALVCITFVLHFQTMLAFREPESLPYSGLYHSDVLALGNWRDFQTRLHRALMSNVELCTCNGCHR